MPLICRKCGEQNTDAALMCSMCGEVLQRVTDGVAEPVQARRPGTPQMDPQTTPLNRMAPQPGRPMASPPPRSVGGTPPLPGSPRPVQRMMQTQPLDYVGFWMRFVAALIDGILLGIVSAPIFFGFLLSAILAALSGKSAAAMGMLTIGALLLLVINLGYFVLMESLPTQGTLGKMALGMKVTDLAGNRISVGRAIGRSLAKQIHNFVNYAGLALFAIIGTTKSRTNILELVVLIIFLYAYVRAGFDERKQALHDSVAGTYVVRK